ncbi:GL19741 [Drosophila persimilis]|uniref:GL19741 n=1 Tax=Drosophila persimilis TaxID=7234 RepID=B4HB43_DROPE|nr:GL19741 [Drosophila persimilis]
MSIEEEVQDAGSKEAALSKAADQSERMNRDERENIRQMALLASKGVNPENIPLQCEFELQLRMAACWKLNKTLPTSEGLGWGLPAMYDEDVEHEQPQILVQTLS